jgi:hypothetical protein
MIHEQPAIRHTPTAVNKNAPMRPARHRSLKHDGDGALFAIAAGNICNVDKLFSGIWKLARIATNLQQS